MDTIVVSTLLKILGEKLGSELLNEFILFWGVKKDLKGLESTISTIRAVLDDAEERCLKNKKVYNWLRELKEVVYDADDLLDKIYLNAEKRKLESYGQTKFLSNVNLIKRIKLGRKIQSINKRLDTIVEKHKKFDLQITAVGSREETSKVDKNRMTTSKFDKDSICGRDSEREEVMRQLKQSDGNDNISVISIVGLGGLGKTTLAQLAYNNEVDFKEYFDPKIWVYVSQDFNVGKIMRAMIESISQKKCELEYLDTLAEKLTQLLKGKRFLLVLDDIWNENQENWEKLKVVLKCGAFGSKIISTTRSIRVSEIMKSTSPIKLKGLSEEMSWKLFKERAFCELERGLNLKILEIAKELVKKCGGVPLALKALGSTMQFKKSVQEWKAVRDSDIWNKYDGDSVMTSLKLSYMNLPSHLKECFTYCAIFPKGHVIYKQELIGQWIAHGFVTFPSMACMDQVGQGNEHFEQLVQVSFLQNVVKGTCNMHDLVHDLASNVVAQELLVINKDINVVPNKNARYIYYMSLINFDGKGQPADIEKVRALHIDGGNFSIGPIVSKAKRLRSFVLNEIKCCSLPISFAEFFHLRYICISRCALEKIPDDIGALWNLQTLHLRECYSITCLPESIGKLFSLRTLEISLPQLKHLPNSIGQCQSLQNLIVESNIKRVPDSIGKLINLEFLKLSLCQELECLPESIGDLHSLRVIKLNRCDNLEEVPVSIGNLVNLECLNITGSTKLKCLPESIGDLHSLRVMKLYNCGNLEEVPVSIGNLVNLECLTMWSVKLKCLPESIGDLHNLHVMNLYECQNLEEVPISIGRLVNLDSLTLSWCTKLKYLPESIGDLNNLRVMNLDWSGIEAIPSTIYKLTNLTTLNLNFVSISQGMPIGIGKLSNLQGLCIFPKGRGNEYACISELEHLNFLSGDLHISGLEYLDDPRRAAQAKLKDKKNLEDLKLEWDTDAFLNERFEHWLSVLEALEPPSSIKKLGLVGYPGAEYPNWMMPMGEMNMTKFPYLTELSLRSLKRCSSLHLVKLPNLRHLRLIEIENLTNVSGHFPSLDRLSLDKMPDLEELRTMYLGANNVYEPVFPCLSSLFIIGCPKLRMQPHLPPSVVMLQLCKSNEELLVGVELSDGESSSQVCSSFDLNLRELTINEMESSSEWVLLKQLSSLRKLGFYHCELNCLPESMRYLSSLRELIICSCSGLHALPEWLGELKSLDNLTIWSTPLTYLPKSMQHLSSLRELCLIDCSGLHALPEWLGELKSLQVLTIKYTPLTCLPKSMQYLISLRELELVDGRGLHALPEWLGELKSLQELTIKNNPLTCLPKSMLHLSSLRKLNLTDCRGLHALPEWLGELKSLQELTIKRTPLTCLPKSMLHLSSLCKLNLTDCKGLYALPEWLGELKSLQKLTIKRTPLTCLPKSMQQLTGLKMLWIFYCPELKRRCERGKGEDWHLISHIPKVSCW